MSHRFTGALSTRRSLSPPPPRSESPPPPRSTLTYILIVKTTKNVKHFDFNFEQVGYYKSSREEIDWTENDFMTIALDEALFLRSELQAYQLRLCGKLNPDVDSGHTHHSLPTLKDILLYRLDDNICYIVSHKNIVWALLWDGKDWDHELRGRYYGNKTDTIHALHVFNNKITMVTKYGKILCEDPESKSFKITVSHSNSKTESNWVLFNQADVAVSVTENSEGNRISREIKSNHMKLECAGMSCATEHGEMLFIGFKDGVVAICKPENMRLDRCEPELYLNVKDYTKNIKNPTVMAIEVFEDKQSHHLFVVIPHHIIHLVLTYPLNITDHYE